MPESEANRVNATNVGTATTESAETDEEQPECVVDGIFVYAENSNLRPGYVKRVRKPTSEVIEYGGSRRVCRDPCGTLSYRWLCICKAFVSVKAKPVELTRHIAGKKCSVALEFYRSKLADSGTVAAVRVQVDGRLETTAAPASNPGGAMASSQSPGALH
jgi:hypothetical protein